MEIVGSSFCDYRSGEIWYIVGNKVFGVEDIIKGVGGGEEGCGESGY